MSEVLVGAGCIDRNSECASSETGDARHRRLRQLLVALGTSLCTRPGADNIEATFEQAVRQAFNLQSVRMRETRARYHARLVTPTRTADSIVLGVPTSDPHTQAVLEASCEPTRRFDEHDLDALTAVAQLGGLVRELARGQAPSRPRPIPVVVPLIGTTPVMQELRARVERVAATDFTVLVEGATARQ